MNSLDSALEAMRDVDDQDAHRHSIRLRFVDALLADSLRSNATDIHLDGTSDQFVIRYRIDGDLSVRGTLPIESSLPVKRLVASQFKMDSSEHRRPNYGGRSFSYQGSRQRITASIVSAFRGWSGVLSWDLQNRRVLRTDQLDLTAKQESEFLRLVRHETGLLLVSSLYRETRTTGHAALLAAREMGRVATSLENDICLILPGVVQCDVNSVPGMTQAEWFEAALRTNPDVIFVDNVSYEFFERSVIRAAMEQCLVIAGISRPMEHLVYVLQCIPAPRKQFFDALLGNVFRRVLRGVCSTCRTTYVPSAHEMAVLGIECSEPNRLRFARNVGCKDCRTLFRGPVVGTHEVACMSNDLYEAAMDEERHDSIRRVLIESGMTTRREVIIEQVLRQKIAATTAFADVRLENAGRRLINVDHLL